MSDAPLSEVLAIVTGVGAVVMWAIVLVQVVVRRSRGSERRASWLLMAIVATIVSIGMAASALAFARVLLQIDIDSAPLSFVASVGRGAMFTAAILVLLAPPPDGAKS